MSRIPISPKHGVNPTIPRCFFCGESKNEVALLGRLPGDVEAPRNAVIDYEPCEACKEHWKDGVVLIGVLTEPIKEGQPPIQKTNESTLYPTGNYVVVEKSVDALKTFFDVPEEELKQVLEQGRVLVHESIIKKLYELKNKKKEK